MDESLTIATDVHAGRWKNLLKAPHRNIEFLVDEYLDGR